MRNAVPAATIMMVLGGCSAGPEWTTPPCCPSQPVAPAQTVAVPTQPPVVAYANPIFVPIGDPQGVWEQVVDVIDDYFRIEHEDPVRVVGNTLTEGTLTTVPEVSPTIFEPWRHDTADSPQRLENTLQTMRRRAVVRVIPAPTGGYWVEVQVFKDLEDLVKPEQATAGAATFRYDNTLTQIVNPIGSQPITLGWIAQGRDTSLEQCIIGDLLSRCGQTPLRRPVQ